MSTNTVGIVVVTYNSGDVIGRCLDSCLATGVTEIVVVDNASLDNTVEVVAGRPEVRCIVNAINLGFAAAVNQGASACQSDYLLILNPDTELLTGLGPLHEAAREAGASCGMLVGHDGKPQIGFTFRRLPTPLALGFEIAGLNRLLPRNAINRKYRCLDHDLERSAYVEQPAGALLMVRRDVWNTIGGFDSSFHPIWYEDVDFCKRLAEHGYRIRYVPSVQARHKGGHSAQRISWECRQVFWYVSLLKYAAKHFSPVTLRTLCLMVAFTAPLRMLTGFAREGGAASVVVCARIIRLTGRFFLFGGEPSVPRGAGVKQAPRFANTSSSTGS